MLSEWISYLYDDAIDAGISISVFWNSSIPEVLDMLDSYKRVQKIQTKEKLLFMYQLAEWTASYIASKLDEKCPIPYPWDRFPELFKDEKTIFEDTRTKQEFQEFKERRKQYYEYMNKQRASKK